MDAYSILDLLHGQVVKSALLSVIFSFVIMPVAAVTPIQIDSVLSILDTEIDNRHSYIMAKEKQLILLKNKLANLPTGESRFDLWRDDYYGYDCDDV